MFTTKGARDTKTSGRTAPPTRPRTLRVLRGASVVLAAWLVAAGPALTALQTLPERLSDQEFWRLSTEFSEPNGYFQSDNLVSNERFFQYVVPALRKLQGRGAYLGVAPDQNFTFIAAVEPKIAFIVDIRRGNLHAQLMYKALFELSADRAEFYSRLFSRKRPESLGGLSTAQELVAAYAAAAPSEGLYRDNLQAIVDHLTRKHGLPLADEDLKGIEYIYSMFFEFGPDITYQSSSRSRGPIPPPSRSFFGRARGSMPSYAELQTSSDQEGRNHAYLASEERFRAIKALQARNLIVPVVGDFAGPKALRAIGRYLAGHGTVVSAFYVSNVEQYLFQNGVWPEFYRNAGALPLDDSSVFIRSIGGTEVLDPIKPLLEDVAEGRVRAYVDLRGRPLR